MKFQEAKGHKESHTKKSKVKVKFTLSEEQTDISIKSSDDSSTSKESEIIQTISATSLDDRPSSSSEDTTTESDDVETDIFAGYVNIILDHPPLTNGYHPSLEIERKGISYKKMGDEMQELRKENSNLKLELNAAQQAKASLELEIRQKEEVIIKTQAEAINTEEAFKLEIKQLKEKLKENSEIIDKSSSKILEQQLKEAKEKEAKATSELMQRNKDVLNYQ